MDVKTLGMSELSDCVIALRSQTDRVIALGQINVTAQFYLENNRKIHPPGVRTCRSKDAKRRESPGPLAPLFICYLLPRGLPYVNWAARSAVCST